MGTLKIPNWVWIAIPVIGLLAVGIRGATQASYYRGIADDAEQRLELQEVVLDSVRSMAKILSDELARADSVAIAQRAIAEREVARLTRSREEAQERTEVISERLRMSLDSMQSVELDSLVYGYENQIQSLYSIIEVERETKLAEALRADQASELILSLREVIGEHEIKDFIQEAEIAALRGSMRPSLGLRLKADWWLAVVGLAGGYVLWGTK